MENEPASPLPYAHPTTPGETTGYPPRWIHKVVSLAALVLAGTYMGYVAVAVLTSGNPMQMAVYFLGMLAYPAMAIALLAATYRASRSILYTAETRRSWLALASVIVAVLNLVLLHEQTRWLVTRWVGCLVSVAGLLVRGNPMWGFETSLLASLGAAALPLPGGIVSIIRIGRSRGALTGMAMAVAATLISVLICAYLIRPYVLLFWYMP